MNEELPRNEDSIFNRQNQRVKENRGRTRNRQRHYVSAAGIVFWMLLAAICLHLWVLRMLGVIELPF